MHKFTKKDLAFSIATGLITGFSAWKIFDYLNVPQFCLQYSYGSSSSQTHDLLRFCSQSISWQWLVVVIPILWILGVRLGYFLSKWIEPFGQFGKFAAIGFTNAAVDFGVLNLLIANTGITAGKWYAVFKAVSFLSAVIPSYFWNKFWAFESRTGTAGAEFAKFMGVMIVSILLNTGIATLVVNYIDPVFGLTPEQWANIAAVIGSGIALIFSFAGFRIAVFKR